MGRVHDRAGVRGPRERSRLDILHGRGERTGIAAIPMHEPHLASAGARGKYGNETAIRRIRRKRIVPACRRERAHLARREVEFVES